MGTTLTPTRLVGAALTHLLIFLHLQNSMDPNLVVPDPLIATGQPPASPQPGSAGEPASIPAQPDCPDSPPPIARAVATLLDNRPVRNPDGFFD